MHRWPKRLERHTWARVCLTRFGTKKKKKRGIFALKIPLRAPMSSWGAVCPWAQAPLTPGGTAKGNGEGLKLNNACGLLKHCVELNRALWLSPEERWDSCKGSFCTACSHNI